jgi:signal transduction histidine kinase
MLSMTIQDNGIGLQPGSRNRPGSFGLVGIEERVAILGGTFSVKSEPGTGTALQIKVAVTHNAPPPRQAHATGKASSEKLTV